MVNTVSLACSDEMDVLRNLDDKTKAGDPIYQKIVHTSQRVQEMYNLSIGGPSIRRATKWNQTLSLRLSKKMPDLTIAVSVQTCLVRQ